MKRDISTSTMYLSICLLLHIASAGKAADCTPPGLVLWWNFADGTAADKSGLHNNGTVYGTPFFTNGTVRFDNPPGHAPATQWIALPSSPTLTALSTNSFTVAIHYKSSDTSQNNGRLFGKHSPTDGRSGWGLDYNAGATSCAYAALYVGTNYSVVPPGYVNCSNTIPTTDGVYHWQILCVDRIACVATHYVDVSHVDSTQVASTGLVDFSGITLGATGASDPYAARDTTVASLCIFNRLLSPGEVAALSAGDAPSLCVPSIALYAGVRLTGTIGSVCGIQETTNLADTNSWAGIANVTLYAPTQIWYDSQPASQPQRYFRVVPGPISIP